MLNAQSQLCVSTLALRSAIHKQGERLAVLAGQYRELIGTKPTGLVTRIFKGGYSAASLIRAIDQVSKLLADEQSQHERSLADLDRLERDTVSELAQVKVQRDECVERQKLGLKAVRDLQPDVEDLIYLGEIMPRLTGTNY